MPRIMLEGFQCNRCGHEWPGKLDRAPLACPKCTSYLWDTPRKRRQRYLPKPSQGMRETQRQIDIRKALERGEIRRTPR